MEHTLHDNQGISRAIGGHMYTNGSVSIAGDVNFRDGFARGDVSGLTILRYTMHRYAIPGIFFQRSLKSSWLCVGISHCTCRPVCLSAALDYVCRSQGGTARAKIISFDDTIRTSEVNGFECQIYSSS